MFATETTMDALSEFEASVEGLLRLDFRALDDATMAGLLRDGRRLIDAAQGTWMTWVADFDGRRAYRGEGATSTTTFLVADCGMSGGEAERAKMLGRALEEMPETKEAVREGRISVEKARVLAKAAETHGGVFSESEGDLLRAAETESVKDLRHRVETWSREVDQEAAEAGLLRLRHRRRLDLYTDPTGMGRSEGAFEPDSFSILYRAVEDLAGEGALDPDDHRTPAQRRADALVEICRRYLGGEASAGKEDVPRKAPLLPHINLVVSLDTLQNGSFGTCEHLSGEQVLRETARRYACDATLCRVVTAGSEILDLGRTKRVVSPALRRAVILRDRHCRWPGCDRPASWGDVHHVIHWLDGGVTALWNLCVLMSSPGGGGRAKHGRGNSAATRGNGAPPSRLRRTPPAGGRQGFSISHDVEGGLVFTRPDGSVIERAPTRAG